MKYIHRHNKNKDGSSQVLIGINLSKEDWKGLKKMAPEEEVYPDGYDNMTLEQMMCWVRIMISYTELWENRNEDFAKKAIQKLVERKELVSGQKRKVPRKSKRLKRKLNKKIKRYS